MFGVDPERFLDEYTRFCKPGYGERITRIRYEYEMTQFEFAELLGVDRPSLSVWEAEIYNRRPNRDNYKVLKRLAADKKIDIIKQIDHPELYPDGYAEFILGNYGKKIRKIRLALGMMQEEFAELMECDWQTVEQWEIGIHVPLRRYFPALKKLADRAKIDLALLNKNPDYFVSDYEAFFAKQCGRKIKSIRCAYDMRLNEFCELIGCTDVALGKWEMERCIPEARYYGILKQLAEDIGITISELNAKPDLFEDGYEIFLNSDYPTLMRKYRKKEGLTQKEFGDRISANCSSVAGWENRRIIPSRNAYRKIMKEIRRGEINDA